ncbi:MAG: hypothetical protein Q4B69_01510 [Slackia sp.]|nr:hypothetical protein [Slackia sp.]
MAVFALAAALMSMALVSCGGEPKKDPAQLNREYMASVNSISTEASDALASFNEAVSAGDIASMRLAASDAAKKLEKISGLTAPEPLAQVHEEYKAGAADLTAALSGCVEAYATLQNDAAQEPEVQTKTQGTGKNQVQVQETVSNIDPAAFAAQIEEVQALYDSGIKHLSDADAMVAALANGEQPSADSAEQAEQAPADESAQEQAPEGE